MVATRPRLALIAAMGRNRVIGRGGALPWRIPSDLKTFRRLTLGKPVIMGRRTWETLKKPLDQRDNLVVTRQTGFQAGGVEVFADLAGAVQRAGELATARGVDEIMVIGGGEIYAAAIPLADRLYLTLVEAEPAGDACFPLLDMTQWIERSREPLPRDPRDEHGCTLLILDRKA